MCLPSRTATATRTWENKISNWQNSSHVQTKENKSASASANTVSQKGNFCNVFLGPAGNEREVRKC